MENRPRTKLLAAVCAAAVIVIGLTGCDNVTWGGSSMALQPPPSENPSGAVAVEDSEVPALPTLPPGDLLFAGVLDSDGARLFPIAFIANDSARAVPSLNEPSVGEDLRTLLTAASEFTLYAQGTRVGTALASATELGDDPLCVGLPVIRSSVELRSGVDLTRGFLARIRQDNSDERHGPFAEPAPIRSVRAATLELALAEISEKGAVWPPSILNIRRDIHLFLRPTNSIGVAASFLYRDGLNTNAGPAGSYSVFVMAEQSADSMALTYADFRRTSTDGKLAPRFLQQLDWDSDNAEEVVLELLAEGQRSFRILERSQGMYRQVLQTTCGPRGG